MWQKQPPPEAVEVPLCHRPNRGCDPQSMSADDPGKKSWIMNQSGPKTSRHSSSGITPVKARCFGTCLKVQEGVQERTADNEWDSVVGASFLSSFFLSLQQEPAKAEPATLRHATRARMVFIRPQPPAKRAGVKRQKAFMENFSRIPRAPFLLPAAGNRRCKEASPRFPQKQCCAKACRVPQDPP